MKFIGPHVSTTGGVNNAPANARSVGATGFGMFVKNQMQWKAKPLDAKIIDAFKSNMELHGYKPESVLVHDGYLINIGNPDAAKRERSVTSLIDEVERCAALGLTLLNIHPGSGLGIIPADECAALVAESLNVIVDKTRKSGVSIVIESTAGQGSYLGGRFEESAMIIDKVEDKSRIGACIDTCHIFAAGYGIRDEQSYKDTMAAFGNTVGFKYIRGLHLNDAKSAIGARTDRHESIGKGNIGIEAFRLLMKDARFDGIPCILETPDENLWCDEITLLKNMC
jgi:deoxyribonuclease-4